MLTELMAVKSHLYLITRKEIFIGMTQEETILKYMKEHDGITTYESTYELGVTRLSARIADLKDAGCIIQDEWKQVTNRKGEKVKVKLYRFIRKAGEEQTLWG